MIPANQPYVAYYRRERTASDGATSTTYLERKAVIAWDDDGDPLVAGERSLVPADSIRGFVGINEDEKRYMTAIPGAGWHVAWPQDDGTELLDPVVAWVIGTDGWAKAVTIDECGDVAIVPNAEMNTRFIPPPNDATP